MRFVERTRPWCGACQQPRAWENCIGEEPEHSCYFVRNAKRLESTLLIIRAIVFVLPLDCPWHALLVQQLALCGVRIVVHQAAL